VAPDLRVVGPGDQPDPRAISCQVIVDDLTAVLNSLIECSAEAQDLPNGEGLRSALLGLKLAVREVIALAQEMQRQ
jgi:hypothetical protein